MSALLTLEPGPDPLVGQVLQDRYRVGRKLGEGGMGAVYEGEHLLIRKRVAIKVLHAQFAASADIVARFHQEALAASAIGHENIVEVNDLGRTPTGGIFMVLELLAGQDFAALLEKEHVLPISRLVHIMTQVCSGVQAAHDKGIVHRDLKPENIFLVKRVGDEDFVKVLDFGISKIQGGSVSDGPRSSTKTGAVIGTAYYMSPEQAQGKRGLDHRTDIWALGVILFRALAGRFPFEDEAYPMLILRICTEAPPPLRHFRPDVPEALAAIVARCLEQKVDARVSSCRELAQLLAPFAAMDGPVPTRQALAQTMHAGTTPVAGLGATSAVDSIISSVRSSAPSTPSALGSLALASSALASSASVAPAALASMTGPLSLPPPEVSAVRSPPSSSGSMVIGIALVVVLALAAVGGWMATGPHGDRAAAVTPTGSAVPLASSAPAPAASVVPAASEVPAAQDARRLAFIVSPTEAVVLIDGHPIAPSVDGAISMPVSSDDVAMHELRIEARGFRTRVEDVRLSYPQRIVVALDPGTGEDDRRAGHAPATGSRRVRPTSDVPTGHVGGPPPLLTHE